MDLEAEYNNRKRVPEHPEILDRWERESASWRADRSSSADLDMPYSDHGARTALDFFWPDGDREAVPVAVFIHGGYWQALDRKLFSHMARGANAHGVAVAIPSYDLCPSVDIATIIGEMRTACAWVHRRTGRNPAVAGHSAGGHLTAEMVASEWPLVAQDAPADLVRHGLAISGVFDLAPLLETSLNEALKLNVDEAFRCSPVKRSPPEGAVLDAIVGGEESDEFLRQSREMAATWEKAGAATRFETLAGANHFTVIDPLADPDSALVLRLVELARSAAGH